MRPSKQYIIISFIERKKVRMEYLEFDVIMARG